MFRILRELHTLGGRLRAVVIAVGLVCVATLVSGCARHDDDSVLVAVAANFATVAQSLAEQFTQQTGVPVVLSVGSSGKLFAQITNGAPYHVFLSADAARPLRLEEQGLVQAKHRKTYALGRLALWAPGQQIRSTGLAWLDQSASVTLAQANWALAPYGVAAQQVLQRSQRPLSARLALAENVGQVYALVASGSAAAGFVAAAQIGKVDRESVWLVPADLHEPIEQQAVLLARGVAEPGAQAFFEYLNSTAVRERIRAAGYD